MVRWLSSPEIGLSVDPRPDEIVPVLLAANPATQNHPDGLVARTVHEPVERFVGLHPVCHWVHSWDDLDSCNLQLSLDLQAVNGPRLRCTTRNRFGGSASSSALRGSDRVVRFLICVGPFAALLRFDDTSL